MTSGAPDPFDLARFVEDQSSSYDAALAELRAGQKRTHWMWFIFPQVAGLGFSHMARLYAIRSRAEARAYLDHPILGERLRECVEALLGVEGRSAEQIMGDPDFLKLQSSMTLFAEVSPTDSRFKRVLQKYFAGGRDKKTLDFLSQEASHPK
jgi:uncharacterized protein (DUF1810 family)